MVGAPATPVTMRSPKMAAYAAAVAGALRERGVGEGPATIAAETGMTVLRVSYERWASGDDQRDLAAIMRESMAELRAVAAGG